MSFFDDDDPPTRVTSRSGRPARPAAPRRPATAGGGGTGGGSTDRQTVRTRQAVALGLGILVLILLIFGVKGCLDSRKERALKDYNRNVAAIISDSDQQVMKPFFELLGGGTAAGKDLQVQVNQVRLNAEDDVTRAKALDVPTAMRPAQQNLELVLNLRAQALTAIAEKLATAQGRGAQAEAATAEIAGQMQAFLASDVVYSQRTAPLIKQALDEAGDRRADDPAQPVAARLHVARAADGRQRDRRADGQHGHHRGRHVPGGHRVRSRPRQHLDRHRHAAAGRRQQQGARQAAADGHGEVHQPGRQHREERRP